MIQQKWTVDIAGQAKKADRNLSNLAKDAFALLLKELMFDGPYRSNWSNYAKMPKENYHCHIKKGRPTYVVCWRIINKKQKIMEVYYAGTHEKAPY